MDSELQAARQAVQRCDTHCGVLLARHAAAIRHVSPLTAQQLRMPLSRPRPVDIVLVVDTYVEQGEEAAAGALLAPPVRSAGRPSARWRAPTGRRASSRCALVVSCGSTDAAYGLHGTVWGLGLDFRV